MKKLFAKIKAAGFNWFHFVLLFNCLIPLCVGKFWEGLPWLFCLFYYDQCKRAERREAGLQKLCVRAEQIFQAQLASQKDHS